MSAELETIEADITKLSVDAIVNAANAALRPGGGVDGAIRRAAGVRLDAALYKIGRCPTGEAVITPGFDLPAKYVIHTVAPIWGGGDEREDQERLFRRCYRNVLNLADENAIRSIAFPAIGTGAYGWPPARAADIAVEEVRAHLNAGGKQERVIFCCFSHADKERYMALIAGLTD